MNTPNSAPGKYCILTFGCQMNKNDSEYLAGMLEFNGYKPAAKPHEADVVVFNTCAVREKAERRVYGQLEKLNFLRNRYKLPLKLYLAGCMPAYNQQQLLKKFPFLDGIVDVAEARHYPPKRQDGSQAWVSIMYGCDNYCSYCIVPYTRGREKSRTVEDILEEIRQIDLARHTTLFLLGQNVNSYAGTLAGKKTDFPGLLTKIIREFPQLGKISFLTSHPKDMSAKLIDVIARYPQIDRELHFPLQAGSDRILKLMNRGYTYKKYAGLVKKIRAKIPEVKISTDLIVGFPSETEAEFQLTCQAVRELKFHRVNTAAFSPRQGTKAATLPGQLSAEVLADRLNRLNKILNN